MLFPLGSVTAGAVISIEIPTACPLPAACDPTPCFNINIGAAARPCPHRSQRKTAKLLNPLNNFFGAADAAYTSLRTGQKRWIRFHRIALTIVQILTIHYRAVYHDCNNEARRPKKRYKLFT
jgi:hypothetical protein